MFKSVTSRRILAYIVDILLVALVTSMFAAIEFLNPYLEKQNEVLIDYNDNIEKIIEEYEDNEIMEFYNSDFMINYQYDTAYYSVYVSIITLIFNFLYFVIFQYYNKGKTIGKALFDIVVVDKKNKQVTFNQILIRSIVIHSLLTSLILIISIFTLDKEIYISVSKVIGVIEMGIILTCVIMLMFREDKRLVHDLLANTKVIKTEEFLEKNVIKEEKVVKKGKERKK